MFVGFLDMRGGHLSHSGWFVPAFGVDIKHFHELHHFFPPFSYRNGFVFAGANQSLLTHAVKLPIYAVDTACFSLRAKSLALHAHIKMMLMFVYEGRCTAG